MQYRGLHISANVSLLFGELPYEERFAAARDAGFVQVETWWPFPVPDPSDARVENFLRLLDRNGLQLSGLNFWAGDMAAGDRGVAANAARHGELFANIPVVARIGGATGCKGFNLLYGQVDDGDNASHEVTAATAVRAAARALEPIGGTVLMEPLAAGQNGTYPLLTHHDVLAFLDGQLEEVGNVALLFDTFHLSSNGVDLVAAAARYSDRVGHVQLADAPGRGAPGTGAAPVAAAVDALVGAGYRGTAAAEYKPAGRTIDSLGWLR